MVVIANIPHPSRLKHRGESLSSPLSLCVACLFTLFFRLCFPLAVLQLDHSVDADTLLQRPSIIKSGHLPTTPHLKRTRTIRSHLKHISSLISEKRTRRRLQQQKRQDDAQSISTDETDKFDLLAKQFHHLHVEDMSTVGPVNGVKVLRKS